MNRCMPWPLAVLCVLDNLHGPHQDGRGKLCALHDMVMTWWAIRFPASEARFSARHFGVT